MNLPSLPKTAKVCGNRLCVKDVTGNRLRFKRNSVSNGLGRICGQQRNLLVVSRIIALGTHHIGRFGDSASENVLGADPSRSESDFSWVMSHPQFSTAVQHNHGPVFFHHALFHIDGRVAWSQRVADCDLVALTSKTIAEFHSSVMEPKVSTP